MDNKSTQKVEVKDRGIGVGGDLNVYGTAIGGDFIQNVYGDSTGEHSYLNRLLHKFAKEEKLFVALAGDAVIESRFDVCFPDQPDKPTRQYMNIVDAANDLTRFVIIGEPGAGKSTSLRELAKQVTLARLKDKRALLPFWIDLGFSENPPDAMELLRYQWGRQDAPGKLEAWLDHEAVWLFLDGLNEMPESSASRKDRAASLKKLLDQYPQVRAIVTCRSYDYYETLQLDLPAVQIQPLDSERIQVFAEKRLSERAEKFLNALSTDALQNMARNPCALAMLTDIYREREQLPSDLNRLYTVYLELRYKDSHKRGLMRLSWDELKAVLENLGFCMFAENQSTVASQDWITSWLQKTLPSSGWGNKLLTRLGFAPNIKQEALRDGFDLNVLVQDKQSNSIRFIHQSIHGYLALPGLMEAMGENPRWFIYQISALGETAAPAVPALLAIVHNNPNDDLIRHDVIQSLRAIGASAIEVDMGILPMLVDALKIHDMGIRWEAAEALGQIGTSKAVEMLIEILQNKDEHKWTHEAAAIALGRIGVPASVPAVPALVDVLICDDWVEGTEDAQDAAANALSKIGREAVPALIDALRHIRSKCLDSQKSIFPKIIEALVKIGNPALPLLIDALHKNSNIAEVLGKIGSSEAVPALIDAYNVYPRPFIIEALAEIGSPDAIPIILDGLYDKEGNVNVLSLWALGKFQSSEVISTLVDILNNEIIDLKIRLTALSVLGNIGKPAAQAVPMIVDFWKDKDDHFVCEKIVKVLGKIGTPEVVPTLIEALQNPNQVSRWITIAALTSVATTALGKEWAPTIPELAMLLNHDNENIQRAAMEILNDLPVNNVIDVLEYSLDDTDADVRKGAARKLKQIGTPEALAALREHGFNI
ncbi:MAG: HEAT repeat domain-containing protein [Candidatus Babeliaceae bacterium]|nr:HEAT repeat domain-containing protein [Candidatus Babeliaceae bacterium]